MKAILFSLLILFILPGAAVGQGGWVSSVNPGFVRPAVAGTVTPSITEMQPVRVHRRGPPVVPPRDSPAARLGSPEQGPPRNGTDGVAITTSRPEVLIYPAHTRFARGIHPYVYTPGFPGPIIAQSSGRRRTQTADGDLLFIGMPRADVIKTLGRPSATIYKDSGEETLFFNNATILIQNGFVAVIQ